MSLTAYWGYRALVLVLALWLPSLARAQTYVGPCDVAGVICAEAWGADYAMTRNYAGPLFQILRISDNATLDIGQDPATHKADMTTWSAFCGGALNNCLYIKLYAQIHRHANDLVPRCYTSCGQTKFLIDGATGLPIMNSSVSCCGGSNAAFDVGGTDGTLTGIPGGWNPVSIFYLGVPIAADYCCGIFGLTHQYGLQFNAPGNDFSLALPYGWIRYHCLTSISFCLAIDEEGAPIFNGLNTQYSTTLFSNVFAAVTLDTSIPSTTAYMNGSQNWTSNIPINSLNPGNHLHFGSGGDGSTPDPYITREMMITNSVLTLAQYRAVFANVQARFPALTFQSLHSN